MHVAVKHGCRRTLDELALLLPEVLKMIIDTGLPDSEKVGIIIILLQPFYERLLPCILKFEQKLFKL